MTSGGKSAKLKPLKNVEHVVINLAEPRSGNSILKRSNAVCSPSEILEGT